MGKETNAYFFVRININYIYFLQLYQKFISEYMTNYTHFTKNLQYFVNIIKFTKYSKLN